MALPGLWLAGNIVMARQVHAQDSTWVIRCGTYAGDTIAIDHSAATRRGSAFWRVSRIGGQRRIVGWNPSRLPARVAFRAERGVAPPDSIAFWTILHMMEADLGMRLFEPAVLAAHDDPEDVIVVDFRPMTAAAGLTSVTWAKSGALYDARVYLRSTATLRDQRIVTHEMMHALGFGHTSSWTSVMNGYDGSTRRLTKSDVAYVQAALDLRAEGESEDMWARLAQIAERGSIPGVAELRAGTPAGRR